MCNILFYYKHLSNSLFAVISPIIVTIWLIHYHSESEPNSGTETYLCQALTEYKKIVFFLKENLNNLNKAKQQRTDDQQEMNEEQDCNWKEKGDRMSSGFRYGEAWDFLTYQLPFCH